MCRPGLCIRWATIKARDPNLDALYETSSIDGLKAEAAVLVEADAEEVRDRFYEAKFAYVSCFTYFLGEQPDSNALQRAFERRGAPGCRQRRSRRAGDGAGRGR